MVWGLGGFPEGKHPSKYATTCSRGFLGFCGAFESLCNGFLQTTPVQPYNWTSMVEGSGFRVLWSPNCLKLSQPESIVLVAHIPLA